jgi:hypothetical protein
VARQEQGVRWDAAFLVQAFNSCRLFAFCERVLFSTPYYPADCRVSTALPASIRIVKGGDTAFAAEMGAGSAAAKPSRSGHEVWDGPVFLPRGRGDKDTTGRLFHARLEGFSRAYPFLPSDDTVTIRPSQGAEIFQALVDSRFAATEWTVRDDAAHAKSKTYGRSDAM